MGQKVYTFSEFRLNEGLFDFFKKNKSPISKIFKAEDDDLAERILNYLKLNFNENDLEFDINHKYPVSKSKDSEDKFIYKYLIRPRPKNQDIDPLGEEDWGDGRDADTIITIQKTRGGGYSDEKPVKEIFINDTPLIISKNLFDDIWDIVDFPRAEAERIENEEIKRLADEAAEAAEAKRIEDQRIKDEKDAKDKAFKEQLRKKSDF